MTLEKQAYMALRERIMSGTLPVGHRLLPKDLAAQLNISPTPVKGALAMLEHDGLVEAEDRKHMVVRRFSGADIRNVYAARALVELEAVRLGLPAGRADAAFVAQLEALYDAQCLASDRGTQEGLAEAVRLDREFHELLVSLSANPILMDWHRALMWQTHTLRTYSLLSYEFGRARSEHLAILEACRGGDLPRLTELLGAHLGASREDLLRRVANHSPHPSEAS